MNKSCIEKRSLSGNFFKYVLYENLNFYWCRETNIMRKVPDRVSITEEQIMSGQLKSTDFYIFFINNVFITFFNIIFQVIMGTPFVKGCRKS